ncbi:molybdate ABC transporter substrate-binding protein [Pseudonocardia hispaniensis]|uniref:Molybdate ABC transporter substrate-binding protein n=1 Tax=Pseudonocardia hispaniensis TaxID=904933 RepID=A0ABW1J2V5_9PSEU
MDAIADLHGDPLTAELVLFMNGNQFMVMPELVSAFRAAHPQVGGVFYETIPPGVLLEQTRCGALRMGELVLSVRPDVVAAGPSALAPLHRDGLIETPRVYASNDLAIMVASGNPVGVTGLADLARPEVRVAMPNPVTEGVGELIAQALERAGGVGLRGEVMERKVTAGTTRMTRIHHRESMLWLESGQVDVCPLWTTEARYHQERGAAVEIVPIPPEHNVTGRYSAAVTRKARHAEAAGAFIEFLCRDGAEIYRRYGFGHPIGEKIEVGPDAKDRIVAP